MTATSKQIVENNVFGMQLPPFDERLYKEHEVPGDGDCGYHAFLRSMGVLYPKVEIPRDAKALRRTLLKSIEKRTKLPRMMGMRADIVRDTKNRIASGLEEPGTGWMENDELEMLANLYDVCIAVWSVAFGMWVFILPTDIPTLHGGLGGCERVIYLFNTNASDKAPRESSENLPADEIDYSRPVGFHYNYLIPINAHPRVSPSSDGESTSASSAENTEADADDEGEEEEDADISISVDEEEDEDLVDQSVVDKVDTMSITDRFAFFKEYIRQFEASKSYAQRKRVLYTAAEMKPVLRAHRLSYYPEYYVDSTAPSPAGAVGQATNAFFYTKKQKFLKKFLSVNTDNRTVLLFHEVGVGKTCSSILMAENFVGMFDRPVLVLLPNSLEHNYKKELFDETRLNFENRTYEACNGAKYLEDIPNWYNSSRKEVRRKVNKIIRSEYTFSGYLKIVNLVRRYERKAKLMFRDDPDGRKLYLFNMVREKFSNRVIVIDEIHNIRLTNDKSMKAFPKTLELILWCSENVRLVMLSATPMFDHPEELSWLMRFAYLADKRHKSFGTTIEFDERDVLTKDSSRMIAYFAKNYVSYMSGYDPNTFGLKYFVNQQAATRPTTDMVTGKEYDVPVKNGTYAFYESEMTGYQLKMYHKVVGGRGSNASMASDVDDDDFDEEGADDAPKKKRSGNDVHNAIQISNIAYPLAKSEAKDPGALAMVRGERGFKNNFRVTSENKAMRVQYLNNDMQFLHPKHLKKYARKLHAIVEHIRSCEGLVLVYSKYIYSGLVPLAIALEHVGFVKYNKKSLLRDGKVEKSTGTTPRSSYIVITADDRLSPGNATEIDAFNTVDNVRGGVIKVALINDVAAEGVSFKNVREIHMLEPWYNMHKVDQIVGRGVRYMSHAGLPSEERNVGVYLHANMAPKTDVESIDFRRYRIALSKQYKIDQVEALLKANAVDCVLSEKGVTQETRRVRDSKGETRQIETLRDTIVCAYKSKNDAVNSATMNPRLLLFDIVDMAKHLRHVLETNAVTRVSTDILIKQYGLVDNVLLKPTLRYMVRGKMPIHINGMKGYLIRASDAYVFQPFDISDRKLTAHDRAASLRRQVVRKFVIQPPSEKPTSVAEDAKRPSSKNRPSISSVDVKFDTRRKEIVRVLEGGGVDADQKVLDAMAADSLGEEEYGELASIRNTALRDSLKDAMVIGKEYYVNIFAGKTGKIYLFNNNDPSGATEAGFKKNNDIRERVRKQLRSRREERDQTQIVGFMVTKKGGVETKIKHQSDSTGSNGSTGSACVGTSTFKVGMLRKLIREYNLDTKTLNIDKLVKRDLCKVYEYFLRKNNLFARPWEYLLLDKN